MQQPEQVAIFWDLEHLPPHSSVSGYETVERIRSMAYPFGSVVSFKAYLEISSALALWAELHSSGVSLINCPHNGRTGITDTMLIVDMVTFALDHPGLATILLISDNPDFAYAVSILRHRKHNVVVLCPADGPANLLAQANVHLDWNEITGEIIIPAPPAPPAPAPRTPRRSANGASRVTTPLDSKGKWKMKDTNETEDVFERGQHHLAIGFSGRQDISLNHETTSWRAPSGTTSRPYSPRSYRSANSSPRSQNQKLDETTLVTNGDIVFESSSLPELPKGFPYPLNGAAQEAHAQPLVSAPVHISIEKASDQTHTDPTSTSPSKKITPVFIPAVQSIPAPAPPPPVEMPMLTKPVSTPIVMPALSGASSAPKPNTLSSPFETPTAPRKVLPSSSKKIQSLQPPKSTPVVTKSVAAHFVPLIQALQKRAKGNKVKVLRTELGGDLAKIKDLYLKAGVKKFASYILLAEEADVVQSGGNGGDAWVSLCPKWSGSKIGMI